MIYTDCQQVKDFLLFRNHNHGAESSHHLLIFSTLSKFRCKCQIKIKLVFMLIFLEEFLLLKMSLINTEQQANLKILREYGPEGIFVNLSTNLIKVYNNIFGFSCY